jgi:hypothetical protein
VLAAYLFLGRQDGKARPPDAYTRAFYAEQLARAGARGRAYVDGGGDPGDAAAALLVGFPDRAPGAAVGAEAAALFPRGPGEDELGERRSAFMSERTSLEWAPLDAVAATDPGRSAW